MKFDMLHAAGRTAVVRGAVMAGLLFSAALMAGCGSTVVVGHGYRHHGHYRHHYYHERWHHGYGHHYYGHHGRRHHW